MKIESVIDTPAILGEGASWDTGRDVLWWVDIKGHAVHCFDPTTGNDQSWDVGEPVGSLAPRAEGGLLLACKTGFYAFDPESQTKTAIHDPEPDLSYNRFNDGGTDRQGRFWAGTMRDDGVKTAEGSFYRVDPDMSVTRMMEGFYTTNGLAFSPDGTRMYAAETHKDTRTIWSFAYDTDTGIPSNRQVFFDTAGRAGRPDGGTVDSEGCYWMAGVGGSEVVRITPEGAVDRVIEMPVSKPSKPMWGGTGLDSLFVTTIRDGTEGESQAGCLFAITGLGVTGVPEVRFAG